MTVFLGGDSAGVAEWEEPRHSGLLTNGVITHFPPLCNTVCNLSDTGVPRPSAARADRPPSGRLRPSGPRREFPPEEVPRSPVSRRLVAQKRSGHGRRYRARARLAPAGVRLRAGSLGRPLLLALRCGGGPLLGRRGLGLRGLRPVGFRGGCARDCRAQGFGLGHREAAGHSVECFGRVGPPPPSGVPPRPIRRPGATGSLPHRGHCGGGCGPGVDRDREEVEERRQLAAGCVRSGLRAASEPEVRYQERGGGRGHRQEGTEAAGRTRRENRGGEHGRQGGAHLGGHQVAGGQAGGLAGGLELRGQVGSRAESPRRDPARGREERRQAALASAAAQQQDQAAAPSAPAAKPSAMAITALSPYGGVSPLTRARRRIANHAPTCIATAIPASQIVNGLARSPPTKPGTRQLGEQRAAERHQHHHERGEARLRRGGRHLARQAGARPRTPRRIGAAAPRGRRPRGAGAGTPRRSPPWTGPPRGRRSARARRRSSRRARAPRPRVELAARRPGSRRRPARSRRAASGRPASASARRWPRARRRARPPRGSGRGACAAGARRASNT